MLVEKRTELMLFAAAAIVYLLFLGQNTFRRGLFSSPDSSERRASKIATSKADSVACELSECYSRGDYRSLIRVWGLTKRLPEGSPCPEVQLSQVVEAMQRFKKDNVSIVQELHDFLSKVEDVDISILNDLLEVVESEEARFAQASFKIIGIDHHGQRRESGCGALAQKMDAELVAGILSIYSKIGLEPDQRTYEIRLNMLFTLRKFNEVKELHEEMGNKLGVSTKANFIMIKAAIKMGNLEESIKSFKRVEELWSSFNADSQHLVSMIVDLACKEHQLHRIFTDLTDITLTSEVIATMLQEAVLTKDSVSVKKIEAIVEEQKINLGDASYALLIRGQGADGESVTALFEQILEKKIEFTVDIALAILNYCAMVQESHLADRLLEEMKPKQLPVLSHLTRLYADLGQYGKACDVFQAEMLPVVGVKSDCDSPIRIASIDPRLEKAVVNAALKCNRSELAKRLLDQCPSDLSKHIGMIRNMSMARNLQGVFSVFESLTSSGLDLNAVVYNTVLDACVECGDLEKAQEWMISMRSKGFVDVVSYNTLIKAHLHQGKFDEARTLMQQMKDCGLSPNRVTYNELLNTAVQRHKTNPTLTWDLIDEMRSNGIAPNHVTCSILLKNLNERSSLSEVMRTMELINTGDEPMDEVLLSSVVEACVRIGKPELLAQKLKQLQVNNHLTINGAHTFGSLIKAYGHAKDIDGVWRCWKEMRSRNIRPTSITLGCMVEAVVNNGDVEGAYDLIHQMSLDEQCRDCLNAIIYCSVLKGFARLKKLDRVWQIYQEMLDKEMDFSIITYNTLVDACARSGRMDQVPRLIEDMKKKQIKPNVITYSAMVKGHCQKGDVRLGFGILDQMRQDTDLKPDEIMQPSTATKLKISQQEMAASVGIQNDACFVAERGAARFPILHLPNRCQAAGCICNASGKHNKFLNWFGLFSFTEDDALQLLDQMQSEGVRPSNFTLSIVVKLMNRAHKLDRAFQLVDQISRRYKFRPNVHVYTNLIQACVSNRQLSRGVSVFHDIIKQNISPDARTFTVLLRGCCNGKDFETAEQIFRAALGIPCSHPLLHTLSLRQANS
eukprot:gene724-654_t